VDSNIASHAPKVLQWIMVPIFYVFFAAPVKAARPIVRMLTEECAVTADVSRQSRYVAKVLWSIVWLSVLKC